jgi:hypothetical protein
LANGIGDRAKVRLLLSEIQLGTLKVIDVGIDPIPTDKFALFVEDRRCSNLEPAKFSIEAAPPALLLRGDDGLERLEATCTVVGLFEKWDCTMEERELAPGDTVLLYTDGVTEALNAEGEQFGEERLLEAARQHRELSPPELLAAVSDQSRRFSPHEQADDITLIVAKCK